MEDVLVEQVFKDLQSRGFKILERLGDRMFVAEKKDRYLSTSWWRAWRLRFTLC